MKNKVLVELIVPEMEVSYDVFLPINKKIGNIVVLLNKAIAELTNDCYKGSNKTALYNKINNKKYNSNDLLSNTDIRNGTILILL